MLRLHFFKKIRAIFKEVSSFLINAKNPDDKAFNIPVVFSFV